MKSESITLRLLIAGFAIFSATTVLFGAVNPAKDFIDCDTVILMSGEQILVKITKVNSKVLKYTDCDDETKKYVIPTSMLAEAHYASGRQVIWKGTNLYRERLNERQQLKEKQKVKVSREVKLFRALGVVLVILALVSIPVSIVGAVLVCWEAGMGCLLLIVWMLPTLLTILGVKAFRKARKLKRKG
ncbi:hypothetical protein [Phaeodactylibacter xiamenensis]|uniref:hypothetical protein n=1 Tax=Phaeodactylibacter xiamenensis TaxID=1524460 RepID=UPI0024A91DD3|nr:hypothetical protein [Phaeodactylibacter xiamenensis]